MNISPLLLSVGLFGILSVAPAVGQTTLVEYQFNGGSRNPVNVDPSVTATILTSADTRVVSTSAGSNNNLYYLLKSASTGAPELPHTQADALTGDSYVSFTLSAVSAPLNLGTMAFDFGYQGNVFTLNAYAFATVTIGSTTTTYTASIYDPRTDTPADYFAGATGSIATDTIEKATIDFGGLELEDSAVIRLYTYYDNLQRPSGSGDLPSGTAYSLRVDNIAISTQAIPEPGTVVLTLAGVIGVAALRRMRRA